MFTIVIKYAEGNVECYTSDAPYDEITIIQRRSRDQIEWFKIMNTETAQIVDETMMVN